MVLKLREAGIKAESFDITTPEGLGTMAWVDLVDDVIPVAAVIRREGFFSATTRSWHGTLPTVEEVLRHV